MSTHLACTQGSEEISFHQMLATCAIDDSSTMRQLGQQVCIDDACRLSGTQLQGQLHVSFGPGSVAMETAFKAWLEV